MEDRKDQQFNTQEQAYDGTLAVYATRKALMNARPRRYHGEGVLRRTIRLVKGLKAAKKQAAELDYCSAENRRDLYKAVFKDAYAPLVASFENAADTLWNFLYSLWYDLLEIGTFIINFIIKAWYYIGAVLLFIRDKLWDVWLWLDVHKKAVFQIFVTVVTTIAVGLILVSSMSAYEYSYYGRKLGTARSKQEVYQMIDLLGDKLSENAGANISFDAERDIEFKRVFGFNQQVDSKDDILNTLTYMKDYRVTAYAININGKQTVILDKEEAAKAIIEAVKTHFAQPQEGYEYSSVSFAEDITVEEVNVVLSDIWNPDDAERYIETGTIRNVDESKYSPLVTVYASAKVTYDSETPFGIVYKRNNSMYLDEVRLVSEGIPGIQRIVALVQTVNGKEVSRLEQSNTTISDPVDAVYYQGTKEIPTRSGTGTWIFPLKTKYTISDYFGPRVAPIAGASTNHTGVDLATPGGSPIYAADGGTVTYAGYRGSFGLLVIVNHGGMWETWYAHCSSVLVKVGEDVYQGKVIARVGSTGRSTGNHLHFEVRYKGTPLDPLSLFR